MSLSLSQRQYPMLRAFVGGISMSIEQAQHYDQRPFRSMLLRGWVAYRPGRGFHITPEGRRAHDAFHNTEITRKNTHAPLTAYFDPLAYGIKQAEKRRTQLHKVA